MIEINIESAIQRVKTLSSSTKKRKSLKDCSNHLNENNKRIADEQQPSSEDMRRKFTL